MSRYTHFFSLFGRAQRTGTLRHDDHHQLVQDWSGGTRSGLRELTPAELRDLEIYIQELMDPTAAAAQRMRRKIIGILAGRGCVTSAGRPDMVRIQAWVTKYGYLHKPLNHYTNAELPRLVTQAERVQHSDLKASANG